MSLGPLEIILVLVVALLVLGPKKLPELAKGLGKGIKEFKKATKDVKESITYTEGEFEEEQQHKRQSHTTSSQNSKSYELPENTVAQDLDTDDQKKPEAKAAKGQNGSNNTSES